MTHVRFHPAEGSPLFYRCETCSTEERSLFKSKVAVITRRKRFLSDPLLLLFSRSSPPRWEDHAMMLFGARWRCRCPTALPTVCRILVPSEPAAALALSQWTCVSLSPRVSVSGSAHACVRARHCSLPRQWGQRRFLVGGKINASC